MAGDLEGKRMLKIRDVREDVAGEVASLCVFRSCTRGHSYDFVSIFCTSFEAIFRKGLWMGRAYLELVLDV